MKFESDTWKLPLRCLFQWVRPHLLVILAAVLLVAFFKLSLASNLSTVLQSSSVRRWFRSIAPPKSNSRPALQQPIFSAVIEPILRSRCTECHGAEKQKAQLKLDTFQAILRGGQNGPVLKMGNSKESSLVQRMLLPLEADGHMPPEDQPQATSAEAAVLEWWINAGAPLYYSVDDLKLKPEFRRNLEALAAKPKQSP